MLMPRIVPVRPETNFLQAGACKGCGVREAALFGSLSPAGLERLHEPIASPVLPADAVLYQRGQPAPALYTLREGLIRLERVSENGRRCIVRVAGRGELLGAEALLGETYADEAVACTPVALCRIPVSLIEDLRRDEPGLQLALMRRWQRTLDAALTWRIDLQVGSALQRMLRLVQQLGVHAEPDGLIWLPRREEMADLLDMALETASRMVSQLRRMGVLVPMPGGRQARLDRDVLQRCLLEFERA